MTIGGEEKGKHTWLHGEIVIGQAFIQGKVLNGIILRFGKVGTLGIAHLLHASQRYLYVDVFIVCLQLGLFLGLGANLVDVDNQLILYKNDFSRSKSLEVGVLNVVDSLCEQGIQRSIVA